MLVIAWMVFIFVFSSADGDASQGMSDGFIASLAALFNPDFDQLDQAAKLAYIENWSFPVRKLAHFSEYAILAGLISNLLWQVWRLRGRDAFKIVLFACAWILSAVFAMTDEFHQLFVDGRSGQWFDVGVDSCGALLGAALAAFACKSSWQRKFVLHR